MGISGKRVREAGLDAVYTNLSLVGSEALAEELRELGPGAARA